MRCAVFALQLAPRTTSMSVKRGSGGAHRGTACCAGNCVAKVPGFNNRKTGKQFCLVPKCSLQAARGR